MTAVQQKFSNRWSFLTLPCLCKDDLLRGQTRDLFYFILFTHLASVTLIKAEGYPEALAD